MQRSPSTPAASGRSDTAFGHAGGAGARSLARSDASGIVVAFDPATGLGTVRGDDGANYAFHCVEIADGTRSIDPGAAVGFQRLAKFGTYEAGCLTKR